jgi:hypothetical protein
VRLLAKWLLLRGLILQAFPQALVQRILERYTPCLHHGPQLRRHIWV